MNTLMDNLVGLLTVLGIFAVVAFPSLVGLAHERRVDRQLRAVRASREQPSNASDAEGPTRSHAFVTTTVTVHS
ncbi:hypothetical protein [Streptomyces sp. NPDC058475]|uniref:hypothetical protein n=1 Tax=Streptomyces sp. NPDC058475 TaxID=3346518 RepID=UPI003647CCFF